MTVNNICIRRRRRADKRSGVDVAHIICTTLLLIVIISHHNTVAGESDNPATSPIISLDATYYPTTLSHANNVALHSLVAIPSRSPR